MRSSGLSGRNAHARPSCSSQHKYGPRFLSIVLMPFLEAPYYLTMGAREGTYHEERRNDPVDDYTEEHLPPDIALGKDLMKTLVPHLAKDRIHHDEEAYSYGHRDADKLALFQCRTCRGHKVAQDDAHGHGEEDPEGEEAVEPAEGLEGRGIVFGLCRVVLEIVHG